MKKASLAFLGLGCMVALASCQDISESESGSLSTVESTTTTASTTASTTEASASSTSSQTASSSTSILSDAETTVFLAGDSTVKTYNENQYIGGWGQYIQDFMGSNVTVVNCAQGGRSSRSFINEGRLYNIEGNTYSFDQNGGKSIEDSIKAGDYLFIQFGHNDDDTKMAASASSNYSTVYDRMVALGTPDANGKYPVTAATKVASTHLPTLYTQYASDAEETKALAETAKYGSMYYAYDSEGTYKWYLKQYIDFARSHDVTPVLVTPVARVKFSGASIVGGAGLHGENFAYVEAVRQLAEEEDCLLLDLFAESKALLETATSTYANYLMALKPNDLTGTWPADYDTTYGNSKAGYTGIEATHYNKYGAYLTAAKAAEEIIAKKNEIHNNGKEAFKFASSVKTTPTKYVNPSNLIAKTKVTALEGLFTTVNVTDPARVYPDPATVVSAITELVKTEVTNENYKAQGEACAQVEAAYNSLNVDDRKAVTNYSSLTDYRAKITAKEIANRPVAIKTVTLDPSSLTTGDIASEVTAGDFKIVGTSDKKATVMAVNATFTVNGSEVSITKALSMGGSASFGTSRFIEFATTGKCTLTVVARSTGSDKRALNLVKSGTKTVITSFDADASATVTSYELEEAGNYQLGSSNKGVYVYYILIEYFA